MNKEELSKLASQHKYDEIIALFKDNHDDSFIFFLVLAYLGKGDYNKVLELIEKHQKALIKYEPVKTIRLHVKTLAFLDEFVKAYKALDYYKNLPYISQEVEETFKALDEFLEVEENAKKHAEEELTLDEMKSILINSDDVVEVYKAFTFSEKLNFADYKDALKVTLKRESINQDLRAVALAIAIDNKLDEEVDFLSIEGLIKVRPSELKPPHLEAKFKETMKHIEELANKDVTIAKNAVNIFNLYNLIHFPLEDNNDALDNAEASVYLAKKYMGYNENNTNDKIIQIAEKMEKIIS